MVYVWSWVAQAVGLLLVVGLLKWCERYRALRGMGGESMGVLVQKGLRVAFFFILTSPALLQWPWLLVLALPYLYTYIDLSELHQGRKSPWFGTWRIWYYLRDYFSLRLIKTADLDPHKTYIFAAHPHGILPFGGMMNMSADLTGFTELFPGIERRGLAASFTFYIPLYRDFLLAAGICDAARYTARGLLERGISIYLVPGGATEALYSSPDEDTLVLRKRLGFVRLALQYGASIVPVFSFNETNSFSQFSTQNQCLNRIKAQFQAIFGLSLPLIKNIIPRRIPITSVCGKPLELPKIPEPTDEEVRRYLDLYIRELETLYENYKHLNLNDKKKLVII
jgi:2-acylglycerol O-acyltransferase 2